MPGVLVFKQDGSIMYKWVAEAKENNFMGGVKRVNPSDVLKIVEFYFNNPTVVDSIKAYTINNRTEIMDTVLNNSRGRILFRDHLRREFNEEALEFIVDVDQ